MDFFFLQEEQVDIYLDDEYDQIDDEWMYWSGNFEVNQLLYYSIK